MRRIFLFISCFCQLFSGLSYSQTRDLKFTQLSTNEGLSQSHVSTIIKDSRGFMWFGTEDGLNKYDGYKFTHYKHNQNNNDLLWVGTDNGLYHLNPESGKFIGDVRDPANNNSVGASWIKAVYKDSKGNIWVGTHGGGLALYDSKKNSFINFKHNPNNSNS